MIPKEIEAIFTFIDFLDNNKKVYINKYIPLCDELRDLDAKRSSLQPNVNYKDKQEYDKVQSQIKLKFKPVYENVYTPIANKLKELKIWSGDETYASIHNNNISAISSLKENFTEEDLKQIFNYKEKYLRFRLETNDNFLSLGLIFDSLDEILKSLFDFFKDSDDNEFHQFETKTISVSSIEDMVEKLKENKGKSFKYSIPTDTLLPKKKNVYDKGSLTNIKTEVIMGDKIETGNISNNKGQISVGNNNIINEKDNLAKKSFNWTKWGIIIATVLTIIGILATIYSNK